MAYERVLILHLVLSDESLKPEQQEQITLLSLPAPGVGWTSVRVLELGPSTMACPPGVFVVHLTCIGSGNAEADLMPIIENLFSVAPVQNDLTEETETPVPSFVQSSFQRAEPSGDKNFENVQEEATATSRSGDGETPAESTADEEHKKPNLLWSLFFNCLDTSGQELNDSCPENVIVCAGPNWTIDFEHSVQEVKLHELLFYKLS